MNTNHVLQRTHRLTLGWRLAFDSGNTDTPWIVLSPDEATASLGFALDRGFVLNDALEKTTIPGKVLEVLDELSDQLIKAGLYSCPD